jgi:hypothetical protein
MQWLTHMTARSRAFSFAARTNGFTQRGSKLSLKPVQSVAQTAGYRCASSTLWLFPASADYSNRTFRSLSPSRSRNCLICL